MAASPGKHFSHHLAGSPRSLTRRAPLLPKLQPHLALHSPESTSTAPCRIECLTPLAVLITTSIEAACTPAAAFVLSVALNRQPLRSLMAVSSSSILAHTGSLWDFDLLSFFCAIAASTACTISSSKLAEAEEFNQELEASIGVSRMYLHTEAELHRPNRPTTDGSNPRPSALTVARPSLSAASSIKSAMLSFVMTLPCSSGKRGNLLSSLPPTANLLCNTLL
eukprot:1215239-Amphidinium_carterae.1